MGGSQHFVVVGFAFRFDDFPVASCLSREERAGQAARSGDRKPRHPRQRTRIALGNKSRSGAFAACPSEIGRRLLDQPRRRPSPAARRQAAEASRRCSCSAIFLRSPRRIAHSLGSIAANGVAGHVVQVCDPAEETLPYPGRVRIRRDGRPADLCRRQDGKPARGLSGEVPANSASAVRDIARRVGWSFAVHRTDEPPLRDAARFHGLIGGDKSRANRRREAF